MPTLIRLLELGAEYNDVLLTIRSEMQRPDPDWQRLEGLHTGAAHKIRAITACRELLAISKKPPSKMQMRSRSEPLQVLFV